VLITPPPLFSLLMSVEIAPVSTELVVDDDTPNFLPTAIKEHLMPNELKLHVQANRATLGTHRSSFALHAMQTDRIDNFSSEKIQNAREDCLDSQAQAYRGFAMQPATMTLT